MQNYKGQTMEILTVKEIGTDSYLVNGTITVPKADGNRHYRMVEEWLAEGNTPEPEFTKEQVAEHLKAKYKGYYLAYFNAKLQKLDYDSLATVNIWINDDVYGSEAMAIIQWYKSIVKIYYAILDAVTSEIKYNEQWIAIIPTKKEYLAELPTYPL